MLGSIPGPAPSTPSSPGVDGFVAQYGPLAQRVGERIGVAPELLLGQWGLETGWGKSIIPGTNNLGNIKDFSKRPDSVYAVDNQTKTNDAYRRFGSEDEFGDHFADLLTRRYGGALKSGDDSQRFFSNLKNGGYAEDKDYVTKGVRAANMAAVALGKSPQTLAVRGGAANPAGSAATGARVPGEYHDPYGDVEMTPRRSNWQIFKDAAQSGLESSKGLGAGFAALLSSTMGNNPNEGLTKELLDYSNGQSQKAAKLQGDAASFTDAIGEGGDLGRWAANAAGYLGYQVGEAILTGGIGGFIGKAVGKKAVGALASGLVEKEIGKLAATDAAKAMTQDQIAALAAGKVAAQMSAASAIFANNVRQEGGSIYSDALEEQAKDPTKQADLGRIWLASLAAAGVDTAADVAMAKGVLGMREGSTAATFAGRAAREIPKGMAVQGGTEGLQTVIEQAGAKKEIGTPESVRDIVDSAAIGAFGGLGGGAVSAVHKRTAELAPVAAAAEQPGNTLSRAAMAGNTPEAIANAVQQEQAAAQQQEAANAPAPDPLAQRSQAVVAAARAPGVLDAMRAEGSPVDAKRFLNDLAIAQSPSTPAAAREQALSRLEYAMEWAGQNVPATPTTSVDALAGTDNLPPSAPRSEPTTPEQRRAGADRDAVLQQQANEAGTTFDRQNALEQAATNRQQTMGAPKDSTVPPGNIGAPPAEAESAATRQRRLEEAALAGKDANRKAEDDPRQLVINRAMRAIEERGGVASPAEAKIVQEAGLGKPYDRIDESLAPPLATDEKLTQATGIALERTPRETKRYGADPAAEAAAEERARLEAQERANARGTSQVGKDSRQGPEFQPQRPVSAPERPPAQRVIETLVVQPTLRTAEQKILVDAARRSYSPEDMQLLQRAATGAPFSLTALDRARLDTLRAPDAQRSAVRAETAPAAAPSTDTPAVFRKRKETLRQLARNGFTKVERRPDGFFLIGRPGQEFKLDGPADAQLARAALHDAIREGANSGNTNPTDAQKEVNNYKLGRVEFDGLKLGIENPIGSERSGTAPDGTKWSVSMTAHYGDVTGTKARDGDALDVYLVDNPRHGAPVFVIDQYNKDGKFDETKTVLGATSRAQAEAVYDAHFSDGSGPSRRGAVTQMTMDEFKAWANSDKSHLPAGGLVERAVAPSAPIDEVTDKVAIRLNGERTQLDIVKSLPEVESVDRGGRAVRVNKKKGQLLDALAAAFGKKIVYFDDGGRAIGDGFIVNGDPNTIYLNKSTGISPIAVFGHELTHQLKRDNPEAHAALEAVVAQRLKDGAREQQGKLYAQSDVLEEITSDLGGDFMSDASFWRDVIDKIHADNGKDARGIIAQLAEFIYRAINTLTRNMRSYGATEMVNELDVVRNAFKDAMAGYLQTHGIGKQTMQADIMRAGQEAKRSAERSPIEIRESGKNSVQAFAGKRLVGAANAWEDSNGDFVIMNTEVRQAYRRRGIATQMYKAIEERSGRALRPAVSLSDDAFEFWKSFRPEAVAGDLRHWPELVGQPAKKGDRLGLITKASGRSARLTGDDGMTNTLVGRDEINAALKAGGSDYQLPEGAAARYAPTADGIMRSIDRSDEPGFQRWSRGAPLVRMGEKHDFKSGEPVVVEAVHGTLQDFSAFDPSAADIAGDWGAGIYASNSASDVARNYATQEGSDHVDRFERRVEQTMQAQDVDREEAQEIVRQEMFTNAGVSMPLYMRFENPVRVGGRNETLLEYDYDPDTGDEGGSLTDFMLALQRIESDFYDFDYAKLANDVMDKAQGEGLSISEMREAFDGSEGVVYATDSDGNLANIEIMRRALQDIGFDGIIDTTVSKKFVSMGLKSKDIHFIAFDPTQVKSRTGNSGAFSDFDADITRSADRSKVDKLTPAAERGERIMGTRASLSADEKTAIKFSSEITGIPEREITQQVKDHKLANPPVQGWAPLVFNRVRIDQGKAIYEYQKTPYDFSSKDGRALKPESAEYAGRVKAVGKAMAEEVRRVQQRAQAGDKSARNILAQAGWYKAMRARLRHEFGGLGDLFADLLGATSPNTPVRENWANAVESLRRASRGDFDTLMPAWEAWASKVDEQETALRAWFNQQQQLGMSKVDIKASPGYKSRFDALAKARELPESLLPTKESGKKFGFNGRNVARAMVDLWRTVRDADMDIGRGATAPKALNFSGNLIGFRERATIDVWAARMLQRLAGGRRIPSMAETGVAGAMRSDGSTTLQFGFGQDVFSEAVRAIRNDPDMKRNPTLAKINDDDLQAVVWFVEKELWTVNGWTSTQGEGGSFELEASLTGSADQDKIRALRKTADSSLSTPEAKAQARTELAAMEKTVDRYVGGLSIQQSPGIQGEAFVPENADMARLGNEIRTAIYEGDDGATVLASKALPTEGRYGAPERSLDLEVVARDNYDPAPLWRTMLERAQATRQDSTFLSRVLRDDEAYDPLVHRPGVEIYFREAAAGAKLEQVLANLRKEGVEFFTVIVDGRRSSAARAGEMPAAVGVRLQYVPEFEQRYGMDDLASMSDDQLAITIKNKADALEDVAFRVASEVEGVSFAGRFWYETQVAFSHEYQEKLNGIATGLPEGESRPAVGETRWQGQPVRQGLESANRQSREAALAESERDPGLYGDASVSTGGRAAAGEAGSLALDSRPEPGTRGSDLAGLPNEVRVDGQLIRFGGFKPAQDAARAYAQAAGIDYNPPTTYAHVVPSRATRIASAFEDMKHDPKNRTVRAAYDALIRETEAQFQAMLDTGLKVEFIEGADPYVNPRNAILDVTRNNHLWVFPTDTGFGSEANPDLNGHPLLRPTKFQISGRTALANDIFRAVHDYFGHVAEGIGFRADGEENAWRKHAAMYSPQARRALTTETRGQNSWVNYGPYAEFNRTASAAETRYAPQKVGLMPKWVSEEGAGDDLTPTLSVERLSTVLGAPARDGWESATKLSRAGRPVVVFRGASTPLAAAHFNPGSLGASSGNPSSGLGVWFTPDRADAARYGDVERFHLDLRNPRVIRVEDLPAFDSVEEATRWRDQQRANGHDGIYVQARYLGGIDQVVAFDPIQAVVPASGSIVRSVDRPVFYSQLEMALGAVPARLATQSAPQWALWLQANAGKMGVKRDEIEWSGILDYLKTRGKDKITASELQAYMRTNGVKLGEKVLGGSEGSMDDLFERINKKLEGSDYYARENDDGGVMFLSHTYFGGAYDFDDLPEDLRELLGPEMIRKQYEGISKYEEYTVPGGKNYREVLITLPEMEPRNINEISQEMFGRQFSELSDDEANRAATAEKKEQKSTNYTSSHWDGMYTNTVAHLRVDDRTDADGARVLFVNEIQSDWGQDGKKRGFQGAESSSLSADQERVINEHYEALAKERPQIFGDAETVGTRIAQMGMRESNAAMERAGLPPIPDAANDYLRGQLVPRAPFVTDTKSWVALAMKRTLVEAARDGYDKVAFINGQQAADLYDLSKQVDRIDYNSNGDGTYNLSAIKNGREVLSKEDVPEAELENLVGKDVAQKMVNGEGDENPGAVDRWEPEDSEEAPNVRSLSGIDLQVGGEGMRTFYDQIVPQVARDLAKRLGGTITTSEVNKVGRYKGGISGVDVMNALGIPPAQYSEYWGNLDDSERSRLMEEHRVRLSTGNDAQQLAIEITPQMREALDGGAAMFSKERPIADINLMGGYKVGDLLKSTKKVSWWDKTVGSMFNMAEKNPEFKKVYDSIQTFLSDVSRFATRAADMAPTVLPKLETLADIAKTPLSADDTAKLQGPVFEGTLNWTRDKSGRPVKTDDVGLAGIVWTPEELKSMWGLSGEQQADGSWSGQVGLYREVRNAINKSLADLSISDMLHYVGKDADAVRAQALELNRVSDVADLLENHLATLAAENPNRADVLQNTARVVREKANTAQGLIAKGYAPLSRFGDHTIYVTRKNGDDVEQVYFGMYETQREANKAERAFRAEFKDDPNVDIKVGTMSKESYKLFSGVTPDTLGLFASEIGIEESGDAQRDQVFQQMLKLTKTNRSAMKRLIERKGVNGFSEDVGRVLAGFVYSNARQASTNLHAGTISKFANEISDGDVKDHAIKLAQYVNNPQEEAQALRGLLFFNYIGGSVASALVNLTQSATTTWPVLTQHFGIGSATSGMAKGIEVARKGAGNDKDLAAAMKRAEEEGITAPQETHSLQAQAAGRATLQSGDGTKLGNVLAKAGNALSKMQLVWGKMFGWAEQVNRKVAFAAAYSLARDKGMENPYDFAKKIVAETQYTMNKGNNQVWARGPVGATLFTFRKFMVNYLEGLARMWGSGPEGKKAFALSLGVLFLVAGAGGMPFADDLDDLIDFFAQRVLNKSWSTKQAKKEFFAGLIGDAGAEFVSSGISGLPGAPIDVSGRMGLGNVIPGTGLLPKKRDHARDVAEIAGAGGDFVTRLAQAAGQLAQGNVSGAAQQAAPTALTNLFKAIDMARLGYYADYKGRKVIDTTATEAVLKGIGFQPASVKNVQEATVIQQNLIDQNKLRETEIADKWAQGRIRRDEDMVNEAKQELADWNRSNPQSPIKIDASQIQKRVQQANMEKAKRIEATAPREIRKAVKADLDRELAKHE